MDAIDEVENLTRIIVLREFDKSKSRLFCAVG